MNGLRVVVASRVPEDANAVREYLRDAGAQLFEVKGIDELDAQGLLPDVVIVFAGGTASKALSHEWAAYRVRQPIVSVIMLTDDVELLSTMFRGSGSRIRFVARSAPFWVLKEAIRSQTSTVSIGPSS